MTRDCMAISRAPQKLFEKPTAWMLELKSEAIYPVPEKSSIEGLIAYELFDFEGHRSGPQRGLRSAATIGSCLTPNVGERRL
jgi:hypothetical protein